jgi:hypothetical protein
MTKKIVPAVVDKIRHWHETDKLMDICGQNEWIFQ